MVYHPTEGFWGNSCAPDEALAKLSSCHLRKAEVVPTGLNRLLTVWKI